MSAFRPPASGPTITIYNGASQKERLEFIDAQGRPVVTITADGAILWRGLHVETDADFRGSVSEAVELMRFIVAGYGTPAPTPRSRLYARYWPYAPDWATHLATDPDGTVYAFDRAPMWLGGYWVPRAGGQCQRINLPKQDAADSLEERPKC